MAQRLAERVLTDLHRRGLVTWERLDPKPSVLMVTNAWPHAERPTHGPFVKHTVDALSARGLRCDVVFIRGYRGPHAYLLGCLAMAVLPLAAPSRYRLVHSHAGETALVARLFQGAPVLASYWGSDLLAPQAGDWHDRLKCRLRSRVLRAHSVLMSASTTKTQEMAALLPERARRDNWVIPDGVDRSLFRPIPRAEARRALGWPLEEISVISVGRRVPVKRLWLAEGAVEIARAQCRNVRWRPISDVPPQEMPLYYNAADCLLHTSVSEGSPNVVKEALACNLPVVATPSGDIPELTADVIPSALCAPDPAEIARALIACTHELKRSNGRARTQHLASDAITSRMFECYASLVPLSAPAPG